MSPEQAYKILGLKHGADSAKIKYAFRRLIKSYHPDQAKCTDDTTAKSIILAYGIAMKATQKNAKGVTSTPLGDLSDDDIFPNPYFEEAMEAYNALHQLLELLAKNARTEPVLEKIKQMIKEIDYGYFEAWRAERLINEAYELLKTRRQK